MAEKVGIVFEVDSAQLSALTTRLAQSNQQAQRADRTFRNLAKAIAEAAKAQQAMSSAIGSNLGRGIAQAAKAKQMMDAGLGNLGKAVAGAASGQMVDNLFGGLADAARLASAQQDRLAEGIRVVGNAAGVTQGPLSDLMSLFGASAVRAAAFGLAIGAVVATIGIAISAITKFYTTLFQWAIGAAEADKRMGLIAKRVGMSVELFSGLSFQAEKAGVSQEQFANSIEIMNERVVSSEKNFRRWGVATKDASGNLLSSDQILFNVSDRMKGAASQAEKAAIGMDLLGKSGRQSAEFFSVGAEGLREYVDESRRLGGTTDAVTAIIAKKFLGAFKDLKEIATDVTDLIGEQFQPVLTVAFKVITEELVKLRDWIEKNKDDVIEFARDSVYLLARAFQVLSLAMLPAMAGFTLISGAIPGAQAKMITMTKAVYEMQGAFGRLAEAMDKPIDTPLAGLDEGPRGRSPLDPEELEKRRAALQELRLMSAEFDREFNKPTPLQGGIALDADEVAQKYFESLGKITKAQESASKATTAMSADDIAKLKQNLELAKREFELAAADYKIIEEDKVKVATKAADDRLNAIKNENQQALVLSERRQAMAEKQESENVAIMKRTIGEQLRGGGPLELLRAWEFYFDRRNTISKEADAEIRRSLEQTTIQMGEQLAAGLANLSASIRRELGRVGDIETETVQKIAIKNQEGKTIRFVESLSESQIRAIRSVGQTYELVTETMSVRARTAADAIKAAFVSMGESIIAELERIIAKMIVVGILKTIIGAATGGVGTAILDNPLTDAVFEPVGANLNFARGGLVPQYLARGGFPGSPRGTDTVPAWLTPGEFVLPKPVVDMIRTARPKSGRFESGGLVSSSSPSASAIEARLARIETNLMSAHGRGGVTNNILMLGRSRADFDRLNRDVIKRSNKRLERLGQ